jgi:hypothetical protein
LMELHAFAVLLELLDGISDWSNEEHQGRSELSDEDYHW